jgi:hypothetical protein
MQAAGSASKIEQRSRHELVFHYKILTCNVRLVAWFALHCAAVNAQKPSYYANWNLFILPERPMQAAPAFSYMHGVTSHVVL